VIFLAAVVFVAAAAFIVGGRVLTSADLALRQVGVRSALGCAITLAATQAAVLLYSLPNIVFGPCATGSPAFARSAFVGGALVLSWLAVAGLVRYVLHPVRRPVKIRTAV
jgi:hypothetical protein